MLKIYLARHGQDEDNARGILNGRRDNALTEIGLGQAKELAENIKEKGLVFDHVYCSPLLRAIQTASTVCDELHISRPVVHRNLIERDFGMMTGKQVKYIENFCAPDIVKTEGITYFLSPTGAETFPILLLRASKILEWIHERHNNESVLLVTHGDIGKMIFTAFYHLDWENVLSEFHFGNSELLLLSDDSKPEEAQIFKVKQYNL